MFLLYLGRDKTMEKITSRFYWEGITNDNREYIRTCDVCQRTNDAKFVKCDAALHPGRGYSSVLI